MIEVEADAGEEWDSSINWQDLAREAVLSAVRCSDFADLTESGLGVEVSVKFATDSEVRALNAAYRNQDKPTNVLSFPMIEPELLDSVAKADGGEVLLGDIVLAQGVCAAEAAEKGVSVETHASHLVVHGTLHLLGYDHEQGEEAADIMEAVEREALAAIGISDPYAVTEVQT
ncbi:MAG TPA: rRNA maturation RNase YbeY [Allosphingosinicella sp.]|nr:rRNA maturation RNase YbeY [Allosphingosinicella sp.]